MKALVRLFAISVLLIATKAQAQGAQELDAPKPAPLRRFPVGAGVGFANDGLGGSGLISYGGSTSSGNWLRGSTPLGSALVEVALSERLRLGLGVSGSYSKSELDDERDQASPRYYPRKMGFVGAALSLRWVLNPKDALQVSPLVALGGQYSMAKGLQSTYVPSTDTEESSYLSADGHGHGVDARLGLVFEYALLPQLFLRLESHFLRVGYEKTDAVTKVAGERQHERANSTSLAFGWLPILQLRFAF
jgi:hypothetical protein